MRQGCRPRSRAGGLHAGARLSDAVRGPGAGVIVARSLARCRTVSAAVSRFDWGECTIAAQTKARNQ